LLHNNKFQQNHTTCKGNTRSLYKKGLKEWWKGIVIRILRPVQKIILFADLH